MKKYAILFTLLTLSLSYAASSSMKRWGTGDVINGRDLTNNFDAVLHLSNKKISTDTNVSFSADSGYASLTITGAQNVPMLATYTALLNDAGTATIASLRCYSITNFDDGGSQYNLYINQKITNVDIVNKVAVNATPFVVDAGFYICETFYNAQVQIATDVLKIEEVH